MKKISWNEFGELVDMLYVNLSDYLKKTHQSVDLIVPILREGGFPALALAYKLNTYKILPIQFKYMLYAGRHELRQITEFPETSIELPNEPTIVLCDTFPAGGKTKDLAYENIQKKFPGSKVIFASIFQDESTNLKTFECNVYAVSTKSDGSTDNPFMTERGIDNVFDILLPWENEKEEEAGPKKLAYEYN
ncbi:MAG: hypothetical protein ACMG6E_04155 [Candidatus Roizmanbacteria bacterium]